MLGLHERIGRFLAEQTVAESHGLGLIEYATKSKYLDDADRQVLERIVQDEVKHIEWFRAAAQRYGFSVSYPRDVEWEGWRQDYSDHIRKGTPEQALVYVYIPERFTAKVLPDTLKTVKGYGDPELEEMLATVLADETRHIARNGAQIGKWRKMVEIGPLVSRTMREALASHYRLECFRRYPKRHILAEG